MKKKPTKPDVVFVTRRKKPEREVIAIKRRHKRQAKQLHEALAKHGQTWPRDESTLAGWTQALNELENEVRHRRHIQRVLDWYCDHGCGALFVPMIGTADAFREKFKAIAQSKIRLEDQKLTYVDDVLQYEIKPRSTGSAVQ